jgi:hypothetical protein
MEGCVARSFIEHPVTAAPGMPTMSGQGSRFRRDRLTAGRASQTPAEIVNKLRSELIRSLLASDVQSWIVKNSQH